MKIIQRFWILVVALLLMVLSTIPATASESTSDYVTPPVILDAKDVLPGKLLNGENFIVENRIENDGLINTYRLKTDYGTLKVESTRKLMQRIAELHAISAMEEMDKKKVFGDALISSVKAPVQGVVNLVTKPVDTTTGIVKGTGRFLSNIGRSIVSDDPHQDNVLKVAIGYDTAKRAFAYEFNINPYSNFEPAMSMLGKVAQASVAGGIVPKAAMAAISTDTGMVLRISSTAEGMRKLVRDNPPGELYKINAAKLNGMGISKASADAFLNNSLYDPQEATLLVGELESLRGVRDLERFIVVAAAVREQNVADYYCAMAQMMAGYHTHISPVKRIDRIEGIVCLKRGDKATILVMPLDFVFRTAEVDAKLKKLNATIKKTGGGIKELWVSGRVDKSARQILGASGWKIEENAGDRLIKN